MSHVYSSSSVCNDDKNYFSSEIHEETTQTSIHLSITEQQTPFNLASNQTLVAQANSSLFAGEISSRFGTSNDIANLQREGSLALATRSIGAAMLHPKGPGSLQTSAGVGLCKQGQSNPFLLLLPFPASNDDLGGEPDSYMWIQNQESDKRLLTNDSRNFTSTIVVSQLSLQQLTASRIQSPPPTIEQLLPNKDPVSTTGTIPAHQGLGLRLSQSLHFLRNKVSPNPSHFPPASDDKPTNPVDTTDRQPRVETHLLTCTSFEPTLCAKKSSKSTRLTANSQNCCLSRLPDVADDLSAAAAARRSEKISPFLDSPGLRALHTIA
ncbi:hypothetical protein Q7P36_005398 [Cladosporium allicinum]